MELTKTKYKHTEAGLIPENWNLIRLGDIFSFCSTSNFSKAQMTENNEVGCIHYGLIHAIKNTHFDLENGVKYYVSTKAAKYESVRDGDVIMVDASEDLEGLNKSVEVLGVGDKKFISGLHTYLLRDKNLQLADGFRGIILNCQSVKNQMLQLAVGMKVFGVSKTQLVNVLLPIPPTLQEQKAIANALSDVDTLISSLEKLIAKKKAIKEGAMQELLTPPHKKGQRLVGFSGEWEEISLGSKSDISKLAGFEYSKYFNSYLDGGEIVVVRGTNITNNKFDFTDVRTIPRKTSQLLKRSQLHKGDLVFAYVGTIGPVCLIEENDRFHLGPNTARITVENTLNVNFLLHLFKSWVIAREIEFHTSVGAQPSLSMSKIRSFKISVPKDIHEQQAIAQILSDMDAEIETLKEKKVKYQNIKQGMMQELLTGKTRLV